MSLKKLVTISVVSFIVLKLLWITNTDLYFCLDDTLYAIPFFAFGYCLKNYYGKIIDFIAKYGFILFIIFAIALQFVCFLHGKHKDLLSLQYACGFIGSLSVVAFSQIFKSTNRFVEVIAKNTLFLIFFQSAFLFITKWLKIYNITNFMPKITELFLFVVIYSVLVYIVAYFTIFHFSIGGRE